ncbi:hypothetical protein ACFT7S_23160 [Streptomyces sp. NPDC057136]|uniref:hypothetical protein n=1 Tax=Streptomyces sp. NPDC057136 TaxID=3346029 RepID=UPI00363DE8AE
MGARCPTSTDVTKYGPVGRDDHGRIETACLQAIAVCAADTGIHHLAVREPQVPSPAPVAIQNGPAVFHDGAQVPLDTALKLVRLMLRDTGAWCRLEVDADLAGGRTPTSLCPASTFWVRGTVLCCVRVSP